MKYLTGTVKLPIRPKTRTEPICSVRFELQPIPFEKSYLTRRRIIASVALFISVCVLKWEGAMAPSLVSLCLDAIADELLRGDADDDFTQALYQLPSELFDHLLPRLNPLALELLQRGMPLYGPRNDDSGSQRKRKRWFNFEVAWKTLYDMRWPRSDTQSHPIYLLAGKAEVQDDLIDDWAQLYWETHLQNCVDAAAEIASLPSFNGSIGSIGTPAALLKYISNYRYMRKLLFDHSKFSDHCQHFGSYARCLRLSSSFCVPEICDLLRNAKLENLEIEWIKSKHHVDGLCALLKQNCETLKSVEFIHCKLSATFINDICDSLWIKDLNTHGIQHFSIKLSRFLETSCFPLPAGLGSFLSSGRNNNLERDDAESLKYVLVHMPELETLDLSDNPIEDGIVSMIPYFAERCFKLVNLKLGNCELTFNGVSQLLETLSTWKEPLNSLSLRENHLGRKMGTLLGKFLCRGIQSLNIDDIGLEHFGFQEAQKEIVGNLKLVYIDISKNRGGLETAKFLSKLISSAPELVAINARYNFMPVESLSIMLSTLKTMKGKLEHLDLTGSSFQISGDASVLAELQNNGKCTIKLDATHTPVVPYDDDP